MLYVTIFLYFITAVFSFRAYQSGGKEAWGLAFALFMSALGTTMISFFAISAINSL